MESTMSSKIKLIYGILLAAALLLPACTRSASNEDALVVEPSPTGLAGIGTQFAETFLSQTAQAETLAAGGGALVPGAGTFTPLPELDLTPGTETPTPTDTPTPTLATCPSPYIVQQGEWVYSIARKCNVDPQAIIDLNNLIWPYTIYPGDELLIPDVLTGSETPAFTGTPCASPYIVQAGEWVYSIARKCGVTPEAIIEANQLVYPYTIYPGDELIIP
jgi:LysM repeat protein